MQLKYRLYRRHNGVFYWQENDSSKQGTLRTTERREAERLLNAMNESHREPTLNLNLARAYLAAHLDSPGQTDAKTWARTGQLKPKMELIELRHKLNPENFQEIANSYAAAFACYQEGKFGEASRLFGSLRGSDKPSTVMAERCADFAAHPPEDWSGVFAFAAK